MPPLPGRYVVCPDLDFMPSSLTPSSRLILMFLRLHRATHGRGATRETVMLATGVEERSFSRNWYPLRRAGLILLDD